MCIYSLILPQNSKLKKLLAPKPTALQPLTFGGFIPFFLENIGGFNEETTEMCRSFQHFYPIFNPPEGMELPAVKNLYSFLVQLSANGEWSIKNAEVLLGFGVRTCPNGTKVAFEDICELSNVIFKELVERVEQLFSKLFSISADKDLGESSLNSGLFDAIEVLSFLFRCGMLLLTLLEPQQNLFLEKGQILLRILRKLISPNSVENNGKHAFVVEESFFRECSPKENGCSTSSVECFTASLQFLEPYNPLLILKTTMLEVFIDELLANRQLAGYFRIINSFVATSEGLMKPRSAQGDSGIVIEAICNHFILSFSDKKAFEGFLGRLFCTQAMEIKYPFRAPPLSVAAAVSLLLNPIMVSAPKYMQAHLISLASEVVHIKCLKPDRELMNWLLLAFEKSVSLYMIHMSSLPTDDYSILCGSFTSKSSHDIVYPPFELFLSPEMKTKVDTLITQLDNSSNQDLGDSFLRMKSDLVSSSMRFMKECQSVYGISHQEEILAILSCLVLKASDSYDDKATRPTEDTALQHLYLLASVLKSMSISLIQSIRCLRHSDDFRSPKTLIDYTSCKEYDFISRVITCFRDLDISLPLQHFLSGLMSSHPMRHMDSKVMLLHFSGLLSLSFLSGLECLVKACLLTVLSLLNLFVFEEGDLEVLQSLVDSESFSSGLLAVRFQETVVGQSSSLVVATEFHKMRSQYSRATANKHNKEGLCSQTVASNMEGAACLEEETEETINGEIFLKCMLKQDNIKEFDDLIDFVECKEGKDYSFWAKNRKRFRKWRSEKLAVLRWKRKKKSWKTLKSKTN